MKDVSGVVRAIGKIFGLDLKQGRTTNGNGKPPSAAGTVSCLLLGLLAVTQMGCQSERSQYLATKQLYESSVDLLVAANQAGRFTPEEQEQITILVNEIHSQLVQWANNILQDKPSFGTVEQVNTLLDKLIAYLAQEEENP